MKRHIRINADLKHGSKVAVRYLPLEANTLTSLPSRTCPIVGLSGQFPASMASLVLATVPTKGNFPPLKRLVGDYQRDQRTHLKHQKEQASV